MEHNMILSASGWRKVFAQSGNEEDGSKQIGKTNECLCALIAKTFAQYITQKTEKKSPVVAVAKDTRPTGEKIADIILRTLCGCGIKVQYLGTASAPEVMAYARDLDGFLYISASHNPIGHNGIKFGLNDGGVIPGSEAKKLAESFTEKCNAVNVKDHARMLINAASEKDIAQIYKNSAKFKKASLEAYSSFIKTVISGSENSKERDALFDRIRQSVQETPLSIVCDMNGSSRACCIDKDFISETGIHFTSFNDIPGEIVHAIIPEPENLVHCAKKMEELQDIGMTDVRLGYMPDCDGDRGNIVYWNEKLKKALPIPAQEVFALCVLSELSYETWKRDDKKNSDDSPLAVSVNCPTSMRIEEIASAFGASVFRAEVGEANVVNLARKKRSEGYCVRILGEGSNGGNITYPSSVRDPLATIFALVKLLTIRDSLNKDSSVKKGLFHLWCEKSGQEELYKGEFTLADIIATLPKYTTTGVSEKRAVLKVQTEDKGKLKLRFQKFFQNEWAKRKDELEEKYGIVFYDAVTTNGLTEKTGTLDWNNGTGGLKVRFFDKDKNPLAFIWMRPSGTEPVFRILCDVKGDSPNQEASLLEWETSLIQKADSVDKRDEDLEEKSEMQKYLEEMNSK